MSDQQREQAQVAVLESIKELGESKNIALLGSAALRLFYGLPRFAQDLDLAYIRSRRYSFKDLLTKINASLKEKGISTSLLFEETPRTEVAIFKTINFDLKVEIGKRQLMVFGKNTFMA